MSLDIAQLRVLIVEDEARMRDLLVRVFESWQLGAIPARTAEEALRLMEQLPCQIVLLDLNLPNMGGMECFERIRQRWPDTQVIILTGFGDLESARRAIHLDVVEFLTKPAHLGELEGAIDRALRRLGAPAPESPPQPDPQPADEQPPPRKLADLERQHILTTLAHHNGNRAATAAELGISLRTLYYRLQEYQQQGHEVD
jgi:two-component system response regulator RegA